ncbi:MAG: CBS domain-containing protein [Saprospiraceae bacterium]|jgi:acetoin utilization protein AcuB|nr:CBS domain-containing protein [Saprospiraceae bacterium]MCA0333696.1 CBS domain-containing protein [Bacteroidota bacterium]MCB0604532.1 CBS domain-containing protein [Saprospiraceae bacterium]MCO5277936.1 CBS domain-containing protein [Saprospiraceae bacterium]HMT77517.1 CBS domain-containing protein [Saprospiraceae bacterium]
MMNDPLSGIMSTELITVSPSDAMTTVLDLFKKRRIHHLPVVDNGKLVGLITTADLLWLNKNFSEYEALKVSDIMTTKLATLEPTDKIGSAAELFLLNRFHAIPVVSEGILIGLVTSFDVLKDQFKKAYPTQLVD